VFKLNPTNGVETVVYSFQGEHDGAVPAAGLLNVNGTLVGTTELGGTNDCRGGCGTVFRINPTTGAETVVHLFQNNNVDGYYPTAELIKVDSKLYGTTMGGGANGNGGTVYKLNLTSGTEAVVYSFCSTMNNAGQCLDGAAPVSSLIHIGNVLYGTTKYGGSGEGGTEGNCTLGCGTVFEVTLP
jgi:uncharacterized repeat protein (TIGR03803 family)